MAAINGSFDSTDKMIDMSYVYPDRDYCEPKAMHSKEKSYPHLYIDHAPEGLLSNVKVGEQIKFTATGIVRTISMEEREGKTPEHRIEINIHTMSQIKKGE